MEIIFILFFLKVSYIPKISKNRSELDSQTQAVGPWGKTGKS